MTATVTPSREEIAQVLNDNRRARRGYSPQSIKYCKEAERNALLSDADALLASGFRLAPKPVDEGVIARPLEEWHEDMGAVLWWRFPIMEAPWVGTPLDDGKILTLDAQIVVHDFKAEPQGGMLQFRVGGWPGYHTHFTPLSALPLSAPGEPKP